MLVEPGGSLAGLFFFAFFFSCASFLLSIRKTAVINTEMLQPVPLWAICDQRSDAD